MTNAPTATGFSRVVGDVVASAAGAELRRDPVEPRTGGPAGNARLTAWTGLLLLIGFIAECVTLLSLHAMLDVHFLIGGVLIPLVLLKTATTGWRIVRYYLGAKSYRAAGPPPLLLRILGPLVVLAGLAVLGSGLALIPLGRTSQTTIATVAGQRIDAVTIHQICFVVWLVVTSLHVLARGLPALQLAGAGPRRRRHVPGQAGRVAIILVTLALSLATGLVVMNLPTDWTG